MTEDRSRMRADSSLRAALVVLGVLAALWSIHYLLSPLPPFGYYYDLGVNIQATADVDSSIHTLVDLKDFIGWAGCDNGPQFVYAPLLTYAILVPLARVFDHDAFAAVKMLQILEFIIAFLSMAWLHRVYSQRKSPCALISGAVFALTPLTALAIRGNVEFGLVSACAPAILASGFVLVRRFGERALPLVGAIAGVLSSCIVAEFVFFVTVPAYAIVALSARSSGRFLKWLFFSLCGLIAAATVASYYILPSLAARALIAAPAGVVSALQGGEYAVFSQDWLGLIAFVPREDTLDSLSLFNASGDLWLIIVPMAVAWIGAAMYFMRRWASRQLDDRDRAIAIVACACTILAMGSNIPILGRALWDLTTHLPVIGLVRTPDRFLLIAEIGVLLFAFLFIEEAYERRVTPH